MKQAIKKGRKGGMAVYRDTKRESEGPVTAESLRSTCNHGSRWPLKS